MEVLNPLTPEIQTTPGTTEERVLNVLQTYLPSNSPLTSVQAAKEINNLHNDNITNKQVQDDSTFFWRFWSMMFRVACQIDCMDGEMGRFVGLVKALENLPKTAVAEGGQAWENLPVMGTCESKFWENLPHDEDKYFQRWRNFNGMMICLTKENEMNCLYEGLISIGVGLEYDSSNPPTRSATFVPRVAIAALWLRLLSREIYQACLDGKYKNRSGRETAWKGAPGYSVDRWNLWKDRLQELSQSEDMVDDVRRSCRVAVITMDAAVEHAGS